MYITPDQVAIGVVALVSMLVLQLILDSTQIGKAIRATSDNAELATLHGLNTENVIAAVFAIGSALAALAGTLIGMETVLYPSMGFRMTLVGFASVVLGGMGRIKGAVVGGLILGLVENLGTWYLAGGDARWKVTFAYGILLAVLVVRPSGIFGSREEARVL